MSLFSRCPFPQSLFGCLSLSTANVLFLYILILNKASGLYGLLAPLTGSPLILLPFSMHIYSVVSLAFIIFYFAPNVRAVHSHEQYDTATYSPAAVSNPMLIPSYHLSTLQPIIDPPSSSPLTLIPNSPLYRDNPRIIDSLIILIWPYFYAFDALLNFLFTVSFTRDWLLHVAQFNLNGAISCSDSPDCPDVPPSNFLPSGTIASMVLVFSLWIFRCYSVLIVFAYSRLIFKRCTIYQNCAVSASLANSNFQSFTDTSEDINHTCDTKFSTPTTGYPDNGPPHQSLGIFSTSSATPSNAQRMKNKLRNSLGRCLIHIMPGFWLRDCDEESENLLLNFDDIGTSTSSSSNSTSSHNYFVTSKKVRHSNDDYRDRDFRRKIGTAPAGQGIVNSSSHITAFHRITDHSSSSSSSPSVSTSLPLQNSPNLGPYNV